MPCDPAKSPGSAVSGFASLLASLTTPRWSSDAPPDDDIDEDVSTISYEQALRTHARYRRPEPSPACAEAADPSLPKPPQSVRISEWAGEDAPGSLAASRKTASITLRMNQAECTQLRQRAADAGLTVSAYLRSCVFEVESLRAQVKDTLSQLRSGNAAESQALAPPTPPEHAVRSWATRLFPGRNRRRA